MDELKVKLDPEMERIKQRLAAQRECRHATANGDHAKSR